jgi:hypothetical protein
MGTSRERQTQGHADHAIAADPVLTQHANAIRQLGKQTIENIIEIGRRLTEAKALAGHGRWLPWLEREFGWKDDTALNFMRCHDLAKNRNFRDLSLPVSGLYLLAAPSTPDEAREVVIERAKAGGPVTVADIKQVINTSKGRKQSTRKRTKAPKPAAAQVPAVSTKPRDDIGPDSAGEIERQRVRQQELENEARRHSMAAPREDNPKTIYAENAYAALIDVWEHASDDARRRFMAKVGLIADPFHIPEFLRRTPEVAS